MRKKKSRFNNRYKLLAIAAGLIIILVAVLEITNTTHIFHRPSVPTIIPTHSASASKNSSSNQPASQPNSTSPNTSSSTPSTKNPLPSSSSGATLIAPFGDFVSNHNPGALDQNGNPTPTSETSVCDTNPGAVCYVKFTSTSSGQSTQLPPQTVGLDGSTSWSWDVSQDAHLTKGEWQITAVASLNGRTKSTDDPTKLTIQ